MDVEDLERLFKSRAGALDFAQCVQESLFDGLLERAAWAEVDVRGGAWLAEAHRRRSARHAMRERAQRFAQRFGARIEQAARDQRVLCRSQGREQRGCCHPSVPHASDERFGDGRLAFLHQREHDFFQAQAFDVRDVMHGIN